MRRRLKERIKDSIGNVVFAAIKMLKPKDTTIIYAGPLMGDALYSLAFLEEYKLQNPQKKIVVWTSPKLTEIVSTYKGYDKIVTISSTTVRKLLWQMWNSDTSLHQKIVENGLLNEFAFRGAYPSDNELYILRNRIFCVGSQAAISYHHLAPKKVKSIPDFYENSDKIIVLNPYSRTTHLPVGIMYAFERLAKKLENYGGGGVHNLYKCVERPEACPRYSGASLRFS